MSAIKPVEEYDVVIIGAGIAGLVCGNYLAKSGLKVLIIEQHYAVGGCCSSFVRDGFVFDSGAHSLGSCRVGGQFDRVLRELGRFGAIEIKRSEPSDTVICGDLRVDFSGDAADMAKSLASHFPDEWRGIENLFSEFDAFDVNDTKSFVSYFSRYKHMTFREMLDNFLSAEEPKTILCAFLGNLGLASTQIAALPAIAMFKEFVLDGGYYVHGGMQKFVDFLADSYRRFGGELKLSHKATRILIEDMGVKGVEIAQVGVVSSPFVVSTMGLKQTFLDFFGAEMLPGEFRARVLSLKPSVSAVVVYLGVRRSPESNQKWGRTVWYMPNRNPDEIYGRVFEGGLDEHAEVLLLAFPSNFDRSLAKENCESIYLFTVAAFKDQAFWKTHKNKFKDRIIRRAEELIPRLSERILVSEVATPQTLYRYTLNDNGAMYGLASTVGQFRTGVMPQQTPITGLYLASHWATVGAGQGGTPMAAYAGRNAARTILTKLAKEVAV